ncbi:MAG: polyphenol oxidase family protein [Spirochaetaceae bacterium]|nr:polyphenol oxidase family protein [Spirochaetaceae bacterium]
MENYTKVITRSVFDFEDRFLYTPKGTCAVIPFFKYGNALLRKGNPVALLSLHNAGSMRYRIGEENQNRQDFITNLGLSPEKTVQVQLAHSQVVYSVSQGHELDTKQGDGIITTNKTLIPTVTAADCMPIYFYDGITGCFGIVHSGWKGTGIVLNFLNIAQEEFKARSENFSVILGPHIHSCCYTIDEERAEYFTQTFPYNSVITTTDKNYSLSLAKANIALLLEAGVLPENIMHCTDCTCCNSRLSSFRRETKGMNLPPEEITQHFTPMLAATAYLPNN